MMYRTSMYAVHEYQTPKAGVIIHCVSKKRHPFYFCDIFVKFHPQKHAPGNLKQTHVHVQFISHFICSYCTL